MRSFPLHSSFIKFLQLHIRARRLRVSMVGPAARTEMTTSARAPPCGQEADAKAVSRTSEPGANKTRTAKSVSASFLIELFF